MGKKAKIVAIGAFDPPTFAHLRMFERAKEYLEQHQGYEIVEGIISIIPDTFRSKNCTASSQHRMAMLKRILRDNRWIRPDDWQCYQSPQLCLPQTLSYIDSTYNVDRDGTRISTVFLCNDTFFEHVSVDEFDYCTTLEFHQVLSNFDTIVICAQKLNFFSSSACTAVTVVENKTKLYIVQDDVFSGPTSGKKVRNALERGDSIRYCTDNNVISYIYEHGLYCRQYPPLPIKKKPVDNFNPWELIQKAEREADLMTCSLPGGFLENYFNYKKSCTTSNQDLSPEPKPMSPAEVSPPIPARLSKKSKNYLSDPSFLKISKMDPVKTSKRACSFISFTFEQHNLSYTPESTV